MGKNMEEFKETMSVSRAKVGLQWNINNIYGINMVSKQRTGASLSFQSTCRRLQPAARRDSDTKDTDHVLS